VRAAVAPFAAIAALLAPTSLQPKPSALEHLQILFIERAVREGDPWSGHMALPGGRIDPTDPDPLAAAIREVAEEVGVALAPTQLLGELDDVGPRQRAESLKSGRPMCVRPFVFGLTDTPPLTLSDEVASALWVPLTDLVGCACTTDVEYSGSTLRVPAYRCGPHTVWGLTHSVIAGLLETLGVS
jgi:8-oxo-dGTP pyrophosphatase MutT (NUDIX family)